MPRAAYRLIALSAASLLLFAAPVRAGVTRVSGPTTLLGEGRGLVKFDAAYDSKNRVTLVAYGTQLAGPVNGILLNENGVALTGLFALSDGPQQSGWARVIYSPEQGRFIVSYVRIMASSNHQKVARFVTVSNNAPALGPEMILDWWIGDSGTATGIAYAAASGKFLVTWSHYSGSFPVSFVSVVDPSGVFSPPVAVSFTTDGESDPEIACDPASRKCLVIGIAWGILDGSGKSSFWARFIDDASGTPLGGGGYIFRVGGLMDPPGIVFSPATAASSAQFLIAMGFGGVIKGMFANGPSVSFSAPFNMIQDTTGFQGVGYGFPSLRYNPASQTTIASLTTWTGNGAVQELNGAGVRVANGFDLIPDTPEVPSKPWDTANQFTVVAVNTVTAGFLALEDHYFKAIHVSVYRGGASTSAPVITQQPSSGPVHVCEVVTLAAAAGGSPAPSVAWEVSIDGGATWIPIPGANSPLYAFSVRPWDARRIYRAHFSNGVAPDAYTVPAALSIRGWGGSDFDCDGRADAVVWSPGSGTWKWNNSSGLTSGLSAGIQWGNQALGDRPLSGDIDGDGISDLVVWRASTGTWYWLTSSSGYTGADSRVWGSAALGDVPMIADFDGDGKGDLVVWRGSSGLWMVLTSSSGYNPSAAIQVQWGIAALGDVPVVGDFDGDGKADPAVWRASTGTWYWLTSSTAYAVGPNMSFAVQWGSAALGDVPLVGDFDGDGRTDIAVWRASAGMWFWLNSSTGYMYTSAHYLQWGSGALGDVPLVADFDGDGVSDIMIWRPSEGTWYGRSSSSGFNSAFSRFLGVSGDIPMVR
jgi:hypothetical protein